MSMSIEQVIEDAISCCYLCVDRMWTEFRFEPGPNCLFPDDWLSVSPQEKKMIFIAKKRGELYERAWRRQLLAVSFLTLFTWRWHNWTKKTDVTPKEKQWLKGKNASVITFTWTFPMNRSVIPFSYFVALEKCGTIDLVQSSCLDGKKSRWFSSLERFCNAQDIYMIVRYTPNVTLYAANDRKKSGANCGSISNCWLFPSGNRDWKVISYKLARGKGEN